MQSKLLIFEQQIEIARALTSGESTILPRGWRLVAVTMADDLRQISAQVEDPSRSLFGLIVLEATGFDGAPFKTSVRCVVEQRITDSEGVVKETLSTTAYGHHKWSLSERFTWKTWSWMLTRSTRGLVGDIWCLAEDYIALVERARRRAARQRAEQQRRARLAAVGRGRALRQRLAFRTGV